MHMHLKKIEDSHGPRKKRQRLHKSTVIVAARWSRQEWGWGEVGAGRDGAGPSEGWVEVWVGGE